jgi:NAD(P)H-nitrite reductase large subunit
MWTIENAETIKKSAEEAEESVVVGGGLLGIDLAVAYAENGAETHYLIRGECWWNRGLDSEGADIIHDRLEEKGVDVVTETELEELKAEDGEVVEVRASNGETYVCDAVAVAIGQTPNSGIVDVEKNDSGMIKAEEKLQTSDKNIYAAGNMIEYQSPVFERRIVNGSWDHSEEMGETAGRNMVAADSSGEKSCSEQQEFDYINTYGVGHFDAQFLAIGDWSGEPVSRSYEEEGHYRRLFFRDDRLVGAVLIGFTKGQEEIKRMIKEKTAVGESQELLEKDYWS